MQNYPVTREGDEADWLDPLLPKSLFWCVINWHLYFPNYLLSPWLKKKSMPQWKEVDNNSWSGSLLFYKSVCFTFQNILLIKTQRVMCHICWYSNTQVVCIIGSITKGSWIWQELGHKLPSTKQTKLWTAANSLIEKV